MQPLLSLFLNQVYIGIQIGMPDFIKGDDFWHFDNHNVAKVIMKSHPNSCMTSHHLIFSQNQISFELLQIHNKVSINRREYEQDIKFLVLFLIRNVSRQGFIFKSASIYKIIIIRDMLLNETCFYSQLYDILQACVHFKFIFQ